MKTQSSIESGLFSAYWDDGLLDILFGCAVLVTGLGWTAFGALAVVQAPIWITLWIPLRRAYVEPHAGYVRFSQSRRRRNTHNLALTLALGVGTLALVGAAAFKLDGSDPGEFATRWVVGLPALIVAVGAALASLLTGARRFFIYGLLLALCALVTVIASQEPEFSLIAAGIPIFIAGGVIFRRFLRNSRAFEDQPAE